jgi:hypothetical protein
VPLTVEPLANVRPATVASKSKPSPPSETRNAEEPSAIVAPVAAKPENVTAEAALTRSAEAMSEVISVFILYIVRVILVKFMEGY